MSVRKLHMKIAERAEWCREKGKQNPKFYGSRNSKRRKRAVFEIGSGDQRPTVNSEAHESGQAANHIPNAHFEYRGAVRGRLDMCWLVEAAGSTGRICLDFLRSKEDAQVEEVPADEVKWVQVQRC